MLTLVLGVRMVLERQVVDGIQLLGGHRGVRRIHHHILLAHGLDDCCRMDLVALGLYDTEILRMYAFALYSRFVTLQLNRLLIFYLRAVSRYVCYLRYIAYMAFYTPLPLQGSLGRVQ